MLASGLGFLIVRISHGRLSINQIICRYLWIFFKPQKYFVYHPFCIPRLPDAGFASVGAEDGYISQELQVAALFLRPVMFLPW